MTMTFIQSPSLVLIDAAVENYQHLAKGTYPGSEVIVLDPNQDGIAQITQVLANRHDITTVTIVAHGQPGELQLGSTQLNSDTLKRYAQAIQGWAVALTKQAAILLYSCQVAAAAGQTLIRQLHHLTGAAIAASTTLIGHKALGGNWDLDFNVGNVDAVGGVQASPFQPQTLTTYAHVLPVLLNETFTGNTVTGNWKFETLAGSANPFLTASTNATAPPNGLPGSGPTPLDPAGAGVLRLTNNTNDQSAFVLYDTAFASNAGLSVEFDFFAYNGSGSSGAPPGGDGISFFLTDGTTPSITAGAFGGSLGYAQKKIEGITGIEGGYVGIGLDEYGNFSSRNDITNGPEQRNGPPGAGGRVQDSVSLRGRVGATGLDGYDFLGGSGTLPAEIDNLTATNRTAAARRARLDITPAGVLSVKVDLNADGDYLDAGEAPAALTNVNLPAVNGAPPATLKFGFASSTGNATNIHEVRNLTIATFSTAPTVTDATVSVTPNSIVNVTGISGTDAETSVASYTITTLPAPAQGTLFLGNPLAGGTPIAAGQSITPAQLPQIFFQAAPGFTTGSFTYTATDTDTDVSQVPGTVTLNRSTNQAPDTANKTVPITPGAPSALTNLPATDPDGTVSSYTIVTLPPAAQGSLFLGSPISGGTPITAGQVLTTPQVEQVFFQPTPGFTGGTFTYSAIDNLGAVDATPATATLNRITNAVPTLPGDSTTRVPTNNPTQIPDLDGRDPDGSVGGYIITALPPATQGTIFIGDPANGGRAITLNQRVTPAQIDQIFFRPATGFNNTSFTYSAIDNQGALSSPRTITLSRSIGPGSTGPCGPGRNLRGSNSRNTLVGGVGNDRILGRNGADKLEGRNCDDRLDGGRGNDRLLGSNGVDTLLGRQNNDRMNGGLGRDRMAGGLGRDRLNGGGGNDIGNGGRGNDDLRGGNGNDTLSGGLSRDRVGGGRGDDRIDGGQANDVLLGRGAADVVRGRQGNDRMRGGSQADVLVGGLNFDVLIGGGGRDTMRGGGNRDRFVYRNTRHGRDTIINFERIDQIDLRRIFAKGNYNAAGRFERYVQVSQVSSGTVVRLDANGNAAGGFVTLATLVDATTPSITARNFLV